RESRRLNLPCLTTRTAPTDTYTLSLHDALPISGDVVYENIEQILQLDGVIPHIYGKKQTRPFRKMGHVTITNHDIQKARQIAERSEEHTSELQSRENLVCRLLLEKNKQHQPYIR